MFECVHHLFLPPVLLSLLGLDLLLSVMARSIGGFQVILAAEILPRLLAAGVVDASQCVEGLLVASFGRNLPVTDPDFVVAKIMVFGDADVVTALNVSSQRAYSVKQSGPFLIDGYSDALVVAQPNVCASCIGTEFDGPDVAIE